jgi:hypothetical protein
MRTSVAPTLPRPATRLAELGHGLEDARAGFGARLTAIAQVENEQRITGNDAPEPGGGPPANGDKGFNGLAERLDIAHGGRHVHRISPSRQ